MNLIALFLVLCGFGSQIALADKTSDAVERCVAEHKDDLENNPYDTPHTIRMMCAKKFGTMKKSSQKAARKSSRSKYVTCSVVSPDRVMCNGDLYRKDNSASATRDMKKVKDFMDGSSTEEPGSENQAVAPAKD